VKCDLIEIHESLFWYCRRISRGQKKRRCLIGIAKFREETSKKQRAEARCIDKLRAPKAGRKHFFALQHAVKFPVFPR
jgi:hypothetical protein